MTGAGRRRLDAELVRRGLADSRAQAARLIDEGRVLVGGAPADKPARLVSPADPVVLTGEAPRFVGRGGEKLAAALDRFALDVTGIAALDAGASTGGFTDCLLQAGAASVTAVDVGRGQLHERLRNDPRVEVLERTDIRALAPTRRFALIVADLSFISLRTVASALVGALEPAGRLVVLVKPQFEAGRAEVSQGRGIIRDPEVWRQTLEKAIGAIEEEGATTMDVMVSPLRGAEGNVEFLAWFRSATPTGPPGGPDRPAAADRTAVADAVADAVTRFGGSR